MLWCKCSKLSLSSQHTFILVCRELMEYLLSCRCSSHAHLCPDAAEHRSARSGEKTGNYLEKFSEPCFIKRVVSVTVKALDSSRSPSDLQVVLPSLFRCHNRLVLQSQPSLGNLGQWQLCSVIEQLCG